MRSSSVLALLGLICTALAGCSSPSGLAPVVSGHLFASLVPPRVLQVIGERLSRSPRNASTGLATWTGNEWLARCLAAGLEWDGRLALALLRIGISLPGTGEEPHCPVYIDGQHFTTLKGNYDELSTAFRALVDDYVSTRYAKKEAPRPVTA